MPKPKRRTDAGRSIDRTSGMWKVRWKHGGRTRYKSLSTRDLREAQRLAVPLLARIEAERHGVVAPDGAAPARPSPGRRWRRCTGRDADLWPKKAATPKRYEIDLARVGAVPGRARHPARRRSTRPCVRALVAAMRDDELSTSSIKHALSVWNGAMEAAVYADLFDPDFKNEVRNFQRKRLRGDAAEMNPPLNGEFERMLPDVERLAPRLALFVDFQYRTGCRSGELLHARAEDVHGKPGSMRIWLHQGVKRDASRSIMLNAAEALLERLPRSGRLFPDLPTNSQDMSSLWGRFWAHRLAEAEARAAAEGRALTPWELRRWRLHDHRGGFAVMAIAAGANHLKLMHHLGHTTFATTQRYLRAAKRLPVEQSQSLRLVWQGEREWESVPLSALEALKPLDLTAA